MDHFLQMIAARQPPHVPRIDRLHDVTAQEHRGELPHLVDVVALLPAAHLSPGDLVGRIEEIERVGGHAPAAELVRRDAEVADLELLVGAHEDVERREIAMQRLAAV